jgi:4-carboxymuconolactone decarboxylase
MTDSEHANFGTINADDLKTVADPPARIAQLVPDQWTDEVRDVLAIFESGANNNIVKSLAQNPPTANLFLTFNRHLLRTATLPARLRQLAIMRVAWSRGCVYMWSSHLRMSLRIGLTEADFEALKRDPREAHWAEFEKRLVMATDELIEHSDLAHDSWQALSEQLDTQQLIDFLFTVGTYISLALVFNAMRIEREPELLQLAARYGCPQRGAVDDQAVCKDAQAAHKDAKAVRKGAKE